MIMFIFEDSLTPANSITVHKNTMIPAKGDADVSTGGRGKGMSYNHRGGGAQVLDARAWRGLSDHLCLKATVGLPNRITAT